MIAAAVNIPAEMAGMAMPKPPANQYLRDIKIRIGKKWDLSRNMGLSS
jgi:hypothetical protein